MLIVVPVEITGDKTELTIVLGLTDFVVPVDTTGAKTEEIIVSGEALKVTFFIAVTVGANMLDTIVLGLTLLVTPIEITGARTDDTTDTVPGVTVTLTFGKNKVIKVI